MDIYHDIPDLPDSFQSAVTVGTFDGVHTGHGQILQTLTAKSKALKIPSVVVSFDPHPRSVLFPEEKDLALLTTTEEKIEKLFRYGIEKVVIIPFTHAFSTLHYSEFVRNILISKLGAKVIVTGFNHHFGASRQGSNEHLIKLAANLGFRVETAIAKLIENKPVSSSRIRKQLFLGEVEKANLLLGYNYEISGKVIHGSKTGRKLGYPTANIRPDNPYKLIPADGIYAVSVYVDEKKYKGMMHIGARPSFNSEEKTIEVHILDFLETIYGHDIRITFTKRLRDVENFETKEKLIEQLIIDEKQTRSI